MDLLSIGAFARLTQLSPKALRLYDELGLLVPDAVDPATGYRLYAPTQTERARLVADLRRLGMPLAAIAEVADLSSEEACRRIAEYWAEVERLHGARREAAELLLARLEGRRTLMYEVVTRAMPERTLLCLRRSVEGTAGAWALGKEFIGLFRQRAAPQVPGVEGATFCIYWGEVSDDSDGPLEWCRPVPEHEAAALAADYPELELRTEPAHREAVVDVGPAGQLDPSEWTPVFESLREWCAQQRAEPSELGLRITYVAPNPLVEGKGPDCDVAIPLR